MLESLEELRGVETLYIRPRPREHDLGVLEVDERDFEYIVREPNGVLIVYLTGYKSIKCNHGIGDVFLHTLSGYTLYARSCLKTSGVFSTILPLNQPKEEYFRVMFPSAREMLRSLGSGRTPLLHDILAYLDDHLYSCKPRIGCEKIETNTIDSSSKIDHRVFRPLITFSTLFSYWRSRVLRARNLHINNWMCIRGGDFRVSYVCVEDSGCEVGIDEYGRFEVIRGRMVALNGCSPYLNYALSLSSKIYGMPRGLEWRKTPFSILCPLLLLNIDVSGDKEFREVSLALWNPVRRVIDCEIYLHEYKAIRPLLYSFISFSWEPLSIEYNKIKFSVSPNELVFLRMLVKKTLKLF